MCMSVFFFLLTKVQHFSHTAKFLAGKGGVTFGTYYTYNL